MTEFEDRPGADEEQVDNRYKIVVDEVRMRYDRNLYDQFPFNDVLDDVANAYRGEEMKPDLAYAVSVIIREVAAHEEIARQEGRPFDRAERLQELLRRREGLRELLPIEIRRKYPKNIEDGQSITGERVLANAVTDIFAQLDIFPDWQRYVLESTRRGGSNNMYYQYGPHGNPTVRSDQVNTRNPNHLPFTYLSWVDNQAVARQRTERLHVIKMLGETFATQPDGQPQLFDNGERRPSRQWRVLKATGIPRTR